MQYTEVRDSIKTGDILLWQGSSIYARIIRLWTGSSYTHVGMAWVVGGRILILQADPGTGVEVAPVSGNLPMVWVSRPKELSSEALCTALDRLKEPYSMLNAIRAGFGLRPRKRGYQCVQFITTVLKADGEYLDPPSLTPGDFVTCLLDKGYTLTKLS